MIRKVLLFGLLVSGAMAFGQSVPAAEGGSFSLWAGVEGSMFNPDWGCKSSSPFSCGSGQVVGIAGFTDVNHVLGPLGMEGEARWLYWHGADGVREANYLVGPRYQVFAGSRISADVKFLAGGATFDSARDPRWQGWSAYVPGATIGYRFSQRLIVRGDYEYQRWPGFVGRLGADGLTPNGFSIGVSYRILR